MCMMDMNIRVNADYPVVMENFRSNGQVEVLHLFKTF